jgi:hypothetical protein
VCSMATVSHHWANHPTPPVPTSASQSSFIHHPHHSSPCCFSRFLVC